MFLLERQIFARDSRGPNDDPSSAIYAVPPAANTTLVCARIASRAASCFGIATTTCDFGDTYHTTAPIAP